MLTKILESIYPIPTHPTWFMVDNSKISRFKVCNRRYFYNYILGWELTLPNNHLVFGQAWHIAMEHLKLTDYSISNIEEAVRKFEKHYRQYFSSAIDNDNAPKNLFGATAGLYEYADRYESDSFEVLHTEVMAKVPISQDRYMIARIDLIARDKKMFKGVFGMDYKTGQRYSEMWRRKWITDSQMKLYTLVLKVYFEITNKIFGMVIDGTIFYKAIQKDIGKRHRFVRVSVMLDDKMLNAWLYDINSWYDQLEMQMLELAGCSKDDNVMTAFPKNEEACTLYNILCPYHSLCCIWANPLKHCQAPPQGFQSKYWNPENPEDKPPAKVIIADGEIKNVQQDTEAKTAEL